MKAKVEKWIDEREQQIISALQENLQIPSEKADGEEGAPFGSEIKRALEHALALADGFGFETRNMDGYVGYVDYGSGDEMLGVMTHLDVVPAGVGWTYPAYGAEIHDGCIYGRGTMDDKGPAIASIFALAALKECGVMPQRKIRLILGCDEESGWACMAHYSKHEPLPDMAFSPDAEYPLVNSEKAMFHANYKKEYASSITLHAGERSNVVPGEATASVKLPLARMLPIIEAYMEKSDYACAASAIDDETTSITVKGLSAHASMPESGRNAVLAMLQLLSLLPLEGEDALTVQSLSALLGMDMYGEGFDLDKEDFSGRLTFNPGVIHWDENGISTLLIDIRAPISLPENDIALALRTGFAKAGLSEEWGQYKNGHYVDPESELVKKLLDVYAKRSGEYLPPLKIGGGTYARCIPNAVAFGCERPGIESPVHMPNEYMRVEDLMFNTHMLADAMLALGFKN